MRHACVVLVVLVSLSLAGFGCSKKDSVAENSGGGDAAPPSGGAGDPGSAPGMGMGPGAGGAGDAMGAGGPGAGGYGGGGYGGDRGDAATAGADPAMAGAYGGGGYGGARPDAAAGADTTAAVAYPGGAYPGGANQPGANYPGANPNTADPATMPADPAAGTGLINYPGAGANPREAGADPGLAGANPGTYGANPAAGATPGIGPGGYGDRGQAEEAPKTYDGMAKRAFSQGKDQDAINYLLAHGLTSEQGVESVIGNIKWVPGLRRPTLAVRWGIGVHVSAPRELQAGNLAPLGTTQQLAQRGGERGGGAPGGQMAAGVGGEGAGMYGAGGGGGAGALQPYAGDLGKEVLNLLQDKISNEVFGKVLKDALGTSGQGGQGGFEAAGAGAIGGYPGAGGAMMAGGPGGRGGAGGDSQTSLAPGVTFLGTGTERELLAKAQAENIDLFLLFDLDVRRGRTGPTGNDTKMILFVTAEVQKERNKRVFTSKTLNNVKVQKARAENKDDGIEAEIKGLENAIAQFAMSELPPTLTPERAVSRVSTLAATKTENPLAVLAEMKLYHSLSLIKDDDLIHGYDGIVGANKGLKLAAGSEEERKKEIEKWLPKGS